MTEEAKQTDDELAGKREQFSKALFDTLAPAVTQCDQVVRGVFHSQDKVLAEIANLENVLNEWKKEHSKAESNQSSKKQEQCKEYVTKLEHARAKVNQVSNQLLVIHKRLNEMRNMAEKKTGKKDFW